MSEFNFESLPECNSCKLVDFENIKIIPGIVTDTYFLEVSGTKPCINMTVDLVPVIYKKCPEYWEIEVVGCIPGGICLPTVSPYITKTIPLTGITGSKGIEVVGANKREKHELPGGCKDC